MSRKIQLSIPEPCHEDWNNMTPAESGRFCGSCAKEVIDFSGMSDAQLIQFFKEPRGSVCGRFQQQQLAAELVIPKKRIPWLRYFFTISLPAFLYSCKQNNVVGELKARAQNTVALMGDTVMVEPSTEPIMTFVTTGLTVPVIVDSLLDIEDSKEASATKRRSPKVTELIKCPSEIVEDTIVTKTLEEVVVQSAPLTVRGRVMMGGISSSVAQTSIIDSIKSTIKNLSDTLKFSIKLYPNPLRNGLPLRVDWNDCKPGIYQMQLLNMAGQVVYTDKVSINAKSELLTIQLPTQKAGAYILTFQNSNAFITYSQKLIIQ